MFNNAADNRFDLLPSTGGSFAASGEGSTASFVGEIDLMATYTVTEHVALQGGHQMLWIDRLALGTEEAAASSANHTQDLLVTTADIFAYGATAAIQVRW